MNFMKFVRQLYFYFILAFLFFNFCEANSLEQIRKSGIVRVGVLENYMPFSKMEDGVFTGFEIELANELSKEIFSGNEGKIEFVPTKFVERINNLKNNKVDMVIALFPINDSSRTEVDFSIPYLSVSTGVLSRKSDNIKKINDLKNKKIALQKATTAEKFLKQKNFSEDDFIYVGWFNDCYKAVKKGIADVCAGDNIALLIYPVVDKSLEMNMSQIGDINFIGVGVSKGNDELVDLIDTSLIKFSKEGFFKYAYENIFSPFYKGMAERRYFLLDDICEMLL